MDQIASFDSDADRPRGVKLSLIRAMSLKANDSALSPNFALHVQTAGEQPLHVVEEASVAFDEGGPVPKQVWRVADKLCCMLAESDLETTELENALQQLLGKALQALEQEDEELAQRLRKALRGAPKIVRVFNRLGLMRQNKLDGAVRALVGAYARAVARLGQSELARTQSASIAEYYNSWLPRVDRSCCYPEPPLPIFKDNKANIYPDARFLEAFPKDATKGHLLEREALAYGLSVLRLSNGSFIASDRQGKRLNFKWSRSPVSSAVSLAICNHKEATRARLARCGLPVPQGRVFESRDRQQIEAFANDIGYPVVCKPAAGLRGIGVVANIENAQELSKALDLYVKSALGQDDLIIEEHVRGTDYRIVVVGDVVVSAVCRETASVLGTGVHTVADLLMHKNRVRLLNPHLRKRLIQFDEAAHYQLERAGLTVDSVLEQGRGLHLANSNNLSRGGDSIEVLDELHPSIRETAKRARKAIPGLGYVGLDIMLEDHTKSIDDQKAAIIELNAHGAIGSGQYPMWGPPRNVARRFLLHCAEQEELNVYDEAVEGLSLALQIQGNVTGVGYRRWVTSKARQFGVTGWVANENLQTVVAHLEGETAAVAALVNAAVRGPRKARVNWVETEHVAPLGMQHFELRKDKGLKRARRAVIKVLSRPLRRLPRLPS